MGHARVIHTTSGHLLARRPLEILAIDLTKLEPLSDGRDDVLVLTDVFSKLFLAIPARSSDAVTAVKVLVREWFQRYGVPLRIQ